MKRTFIKLDGGRRFPIQMKNMKDGDIIYLMEQGDQLVFRVVGLPYKTSFKDGEHLGIKIQPLYR